MKKQIITFYYSLKDRSERLLEATTPESPCQILVGSKAVVPGLEKALLKLKKGDKKTILLLAHDAYGYRDEDLLSKIPLTKLPIKVEVGDVLEVETDGFDKKVMRVVEKSLHEVTLDGNHQLAGQDLIYDVELLDIRLATEQDEREFLLKQNGQDKIN